MISLLWKKIKEKGAEHVTVFLIGLALPLVTILQTYVLNFFKGVDIFNLILTQKFLLISGIAIANIITLAFLYYYYVKLKRKTKALT
ncbi:MAG: hypothetical protein U1F76_00510 [Candidatus Competibacteraceae bacterium]